jgi:hypothetical protein
VNRLRNGVLKISDLTSEDVKIFFNCPKSPENIWYPSASYSKEREEYFLDAKAVRT